MCAAKNDDFEAMQDENVNPSFVWGFFNSMMDNTIYNGKFWLFAIIATPIIASAVLLAAGFLTAALISTAVNFIVGLVSLLANAIIALPLSQTIPVLALCVCAAAFFCFRSTTESHSNPSNSKSNSNAHANDNGFSNDYSAVLDEDWIEENVVANNGVSTDNDVDLYRRENSSPVVML
jgi:hypothetical protein